MFNLFQKLVSIVTSVVAVLTFQNYNPTPVITPEPFNSPIVATSTPITPSPLTNPHQQPTLTKTPKMTSTPISSSIPDTSKLVNQLNELKELIAAYTPEPTPASQIIYVPVIPTSIPSPTKLETPTPLPTQTPIPVLATPTPKPMPTPTPLIATLSEELISRNVHIKLNRPGFVSKVVLEIVDTDGKPLDISGGWLLLSWVTVESDSRFFGGSGNAARQFPAYKDTWGTGLDFLDGRIVVNSNPFTIPINAELDTINWIADSTRLGFGSKRIESEKDTPWFYKILSIDGAAIQYQP